ncbi:MAG TPA: transporter substrate-binding domain-containing protein, partial [Candidatus Parabacteroides intestinavium]|nr:transporter substrate-binding domain-containing protein [Candidatus Parabacteroides intestinavium]
MKVGKKLLAVYICLLGIVLVMMASLYSYLQSKEPLPPRDYPEIKEEGILRVMMEYNPSDYYVEDDTILGFQYELCQAIARLSGMEVQIHLEMSLEKSFEMLDQQQVDVIARNIPITSESKETHLFTDPIILNKQVLVQRTAKANQGQSPIRNQIHLGKKKLYIPKNSPALLRIKNLEHEIGDTIYIEEDELYSDEQLIIQVAKGDIDFAVCNQQNAERMAKQYPEIDIQTDISFTQLQSWAVRMESPILLDSLNHWL